MKLTRLYVAALAALFLFAPALCAAEEAARKPFAIQVVDEDTGRGVPLVELRTINHMQFFTDSNGYAAIDEPAFANKDIFFYVSSHGYEFPKERWGNRGVTLRVRPGQDHAIKIKRKNIAERLYRITGANIYRDTVLFGKTPPTKNPLLNGDVFGSDTVANEVYRGKIYWIWGDTEKPSHPIGLYDTPGATSELPSNGGLDPDVGVDLNYFLSGSQTFAKAVAPLPGRGPTWIDGLVTLKDEKGEERLLGFYGKASGLADLGRRGIAVFNDEREEFQHKADVDMKGTIVLIGHPMKAKIGGDEYVFAGKPFPIVRSRATIEALCDQKNYEAFTCLTEGSTLDKPQIDRTSDGLPRYSWKKNTPALFPREQQRLVDRKVLKPEECWIQLRDRDSGKEVFCPNGSVYWNEYRKRYVLIGSQSWGTSMLGEVWYSEADSPMGPWAYAIKIVTHKNYSFYNPKQHPMFDKEGGRIIYFEGTYTAMWSGNDVKTPNYEYNQMMYKLNLDDPRLATPSPVYYLAEQGAGPLGDGSAVASGAARRIAFFAHDREAADLTPVYQVEESKGVTRLTTVAAEAGGAAPLFYATAANAKPASTQQPLYEWTNQATGAKFYGPDNQAAPAGFSHAEKPLCHVWRNPFRVAWTYDP